MRGEPLLWEEYFDEQARAAREPVHLSRCGWCKRVLRDGVLPETTGICRPCSATFKASREA
jgi:hypothetical protein